MIHKSPSKLLLVVMLLVSAPLAAEPRVAVSIPPIHSLVESLMEGVASAELLIRNGQSPHEASLSPSAVRSINQADLIVWVGPELEYSLAGLMEQLDEKKKITLIELPEMAILSVRESGLINAQTTSESVVDNEQHNHALDPHLWLATRNASRIVTRVVTWLTQFDPQNETTYRSNSRRLFQQIEELRQQIDKDIAPLRARRWMAFHDAYQYFENEFDIHPVATVTINPEQAPGAKRLKALREQVVSANVECVFSEPQFNPAIVDTIIEGSDARAGKLDPVGSALPHGMSHWFMMMAQLTDDMKSCFAE